MKTKIINGKHYLYYKVLANLINNWMSFFELDECVAEVVAFSHKNIVIFINVLVPLH